ncbi:hypothetical protein P5673_030914, partial [Acropora cervicornis]
SKNSGCSSSIIVPRASTYTSEVDDTSIPTRKCDSTDILTIVRRLPFRNMDIQRFLASAFVAIRTDDDVEGWHYALYRLVSRI